MNSEYTFSCCYLVVPYVLKCLELSRCISAVNYVKMLLAVSLFAKIPPQIEHHC